MGGCLRWVAVSLGGCLVGWLIRYVYSIAFLCFAQDLSSVVTSRCASFSHSNCSRLARDRQLPPIALSLIPSTPSKS